MEVAVAVVNFLVELGEGGDWTNAIARERRIIFAAVQPNGGEYDAPRCLGKQSCPKSYAGISARATIPSLRSIRPGDSGPTPWVSKMGQSVGTV